MIESVIFFGVPCDFADHVRSRLVGSGYSIVAQVVPGRDQATEPLREVAPAAASCGGASTGTGGPMHWFELNNSTSDLAVRTLSELRADVSIVCCYPSRLPIPLVNVAVYGGLNVHPSLLPGYRGPVPLFWVYRKGELRTGVTVHRVDERLDTGDIIRQEAFNIPIGTPGNEIWQRSARIGADLLLESLDRLGHGAFQAMPQEASRASYYSRPNANDLLVDPTRWEAWRVYHFCRGVLPFGYTPYLAQGKIVRPIVDVDGYAEDLTETLQSRTGYEWITCSTGRVRVKLGPVVF